MYLTLAVTLIAFCELYRLYYIFRPAPRSKRAHFMAKKKATREMRWDLEFKIFKTREIRDDVRAQYDNAKAMAYNLDKQLEAIEAGAPEREELQKQLDMLNADASRYEGQMRMLDREVNGSKPEDEEGVIGILEQIESLRELEKMLGDYIQEI
jgi:hypothetical protein